MANHHILSQPSNPGPAHGMEFLLENVDIILVLFSIRGVKLEKFTKDFVKSDFLKSQNLSQNSTYMISTF